ncbi:MAG: hypothetical protein JZU52_00800 [Lamprocystis purpurea]|nr:hypothetical protein [Lamprocystis purpurea]
MPAEIRPRASMRLKGYDYTQAGAYFITLCVQQRLCLFGEVIAGLFVSNQYGALVAQAWNDLPNHYPHVSLDQFVVMPNHVHGIIVLSDVGADLKSDHRHRDADVGVGLKPAPTKRHALSEIVRAFKTFSARRINEIRRFGNAIITNTSFAVRRITLALPNMLSIIRASGPKTASILKMRPVSIPVASVQASNPLPTNAMPI